MRVDTADLVGRRGIAARLGVTVAAVSNWRTRHEDFPRPIWQDDGDRTSAAWLWWQVEAWAVQHGKVTA